MIRRYGLVAMTALFGLLGCHDPAGPSGRNASLEVYVGDNFQAEHITITLDDQPLFSGTVTTQLSGLAASVYTSDAVGAHHIAVSVGGLSATKEFTMSDATYVVITRTDRDTPLSVTILHQRPLWL